MTDFPSGEHCGSLRFLNLAMSSSLNGRFVWAGNMAAARNSRIVRFSIGLVYNVIHAEQSRGGLKCATPSSQNRLLRKPGPDQPVELRKLPIEIRVAFLEKLVLMPRPHPSAGVFAIARVDSFDHVHSFDDLPERSESGFFVVARGIIPEIDVNLRRSRIRTGVGKRDVAGRVRLSKPVVGNRLVAPFPRDLRLPRDPELDPSPGDRAIETRIVIVVFRDELAESVGSAGSPVAVDLNHEITGRSLDAYPINRLPGRGNGQ